MVVGRAMALDPPRSAEAHHHGRDRPDDPDEQEDFQHAEYSEDLDLAQPLDPNRVVDPVVGVLDYRVENQGIRERPEDDHAQRPDPRQHSDREPAA